MTNKGFNLFDECQHLSPQEEECISSSWGDSQMCTSGSIANSQRMLTEIKWCGDNDVEMIRTWVKSDTTKHQRHLE